MCVNGMWHDVTVTLVAWLHAPPRRLIRHVIGENVIGEREVYGVIGERWIRGGMMDKSEIEG